MKNGGGSLNNIHSSHHITKTSDGSSASLGRFQQEPSILVGDTKSQYRGASTIVEVGRGPLVNSDNEIESLGVHP